MPRHLLFFLFALPAWASGGYGPVFQETGLSAPGGYFDAGFDVVVNRFGGNLIVSSRDAGVASIGGFGLFFERTYNSNRAYDAEFGIPLPRNDGPLGQGWSCHYGALILDPLSRPEWQDGAGGREIFYTHDHLRTRINISGDGGEAWITKSLKILIKQGATYWLYTPAGLRYKLTYQTDNRFYRPEEIRDADGNTWTLTYESDSDSFSQYTYLDGDGLAHHPLVKTLRDDWGRQLTFGYTTILGKKRLTSLVLGGQVLATYGYLPSGSFLFLQSHLTGEGRATLYTTETSPVSGGGRGSLRRIDLHTGGALTFTYAKKTFFYQAAVPADVYAVTSMGRAGSTWTYSYPGSGATGTFPVSVSVSPEGFSGTYDYRTYSSGFGTTPFEQVGLLVRSEETYNGTTKIEEFDYEPYQISDDRIVGLLSSQTVAVPLLEEARLFKDNRWLTTRYSYNATHFIFPTVVDAPGLKTTASYKHFTTAALYVLGLPDEETRQVGFQTLAKTDWSYGATSPHPNWIRFYTAATAYDQLNLSYFTTGNGKKGALKSRDFEGAAAETYDYQNGVLKSVSYPGNAPPMSRTVNSNGTVAVESVGGVSKSFVWDDDFRLTQVNQLPDAPITLSYTATTVTRGQGVAQMIESFDGWGRSIEREERVQGPAWAVTTGVYNGLDQRTALTTAAGAQYQMSYDVHGRPKTVNAANAADDYTYSYATAADGGATRTITKNGAITTVMTHDVLGRILLGELEGRQVAYSYNGTVQTITPEGHGGSRTVAYDWRGRKISETHPETGTIGYSYNAAGWLTGIDKPGGDYAFTHDGIGRIVQTKRNNQLQTARAYNGQYAYLEQVDYGDVRLRYEDPDSRGRARRMVLSVPGALGGPPVNGPVGGQSETAVNPQFEWAAVAEANRYRLELRDDSQVWRGDTTATQLAFSALGFSPVLETTYRWRVRAERNDGEVGPWSPWISFGVYPQAACDLDCVGYRWHYPQEPGFCYMEPVTGYTTVGSLVQYLNNGNQCPAAPKRTRPPVGKRVAERQFITTAAYDGLGRMTQQSHDGLVQAWTYNDGAGQDTVRFDNQTIIGETLYTDGNLAESIAFEPYGGLGAVTIDKSFDVLRRLTGIEVNHNGPLYQLSAVTYNDWGFVGQATRSDAGLSRNLNYEYGDGGQLTRFTLSGLNPVDYSYDARGNLTGRDGLSGDGLELPALPTTSYDGKNQVAAWDYDSDGNLLADGDFAYEYNAMERLAAVLDPASGTVLAQFLYDGNGERVREIYDNRVVYAIRDAEGRLIGREIGETRADGGTDITREDYITHNGQVVLTVKRHPDGSTSRRYRFPDRNGNPALILDEADDFQARYFEYSPFGIQMSAEPEALVAHGFTGHERDELSGWDYVHARYYTSFYGRFNRPDPGFDFDPINPFTFNLYGYVHGNPVNFWDPTGLATGSQVADGWADDAFRNGNNLTGYALKGLSGFLTLGDGLSKVTSEWMEGRGDQLTGWDYAMAGLNVLEILPALKFIKLKPLARLKIPPIAGKWGPGQFERVVESMSNRAAIYQSRITGRLPDVIYKVNGVAFDGFDEAAGVLLEAKGPGYANFVRNGQFRDFFTGAKGLVGQAERQIRAANGTPIRWHFSEPEAASAARRLLSKEGITGIEIIHTP